MKIATFNVNSIRAREELTIEWLEKKNPIDILCLQELKCEETKFPKESFERLGYKIAVNSQKRYNGVAICSKRGFERVKKIFDIPVLDEQKRLIEVQIGDIIILNIYAPHGESDENDPKHKFKMDFYDALKKYVSALLHMNERVILTGDMNVALANIDVYDAKVFENRVGFLESEKQKLRELLKIGLFDCFREKYPDKKAFTWWDYRTAAIWRDEGMRIDYILSSAKLLKKCIEINVDLWTRRRRSPTPSDHAPLVAEIAD